MPLKLKLAVLAEKLVTLIALQRFVWELEADDTLDLLNHLSLELILDLIHLDVKRGNRLWSHHFIDGFVRDNEIKSLIDAETFLLGIHLLPDLMHSPLLLIQLCDGHFYF